MGRILTDKQREELHRAHRAERELKYGDRIKAVLLLDAGWTLSKISEALLLDNKTIIRYRNLYEEGGVDRLCCDNLKGSSCRLSAKQCEQLRLHLQEVVYSSSAEVGVYVENTFGVSYSVSGITDLLHRLGFTYKQMKLVPGKADKQQQEEFVSRVEQLNESRKQGEKLYYMDGCHPQHNSQPAHGWILKGQDKQLKSNTGRRRININGALDADTHEVIFRCDDTIDALSTIKLFDELQSRNPNYHSIFVIADNAKYYKNKSVQEYLKDSRIRLLFLPPYAPNLNLIERFWRFMKKRVLANRYYESFLEFKNAALSFFDKANRGEFSSQLASLLKPRFNIISLHSSERKVETSVFRRTAFS